MRVNFFYFNVKIAKQIGYRPHFDMVHCASDYCVLRKYPKYIQGNSVQEKKNSVLVLALKYRAIPQVTTFIVSENVNMPNYAVLKTRE